MPNAETAPMPVGTPFDSIVERNPDGILILDEEGMVRFANPAARELMNGGAPLVGRVLDIPLMPAETPGVALVERRGSSELMEVRVSETVWENERALLLQVRDVTQFQHSLNDLRKRERRGRLIVARAVEGIVVIQDGRLKFHNPQTRVLTGYTDRELSSMPLLELVHPDDRDSVRALQEGRSRGGEAPLPHVLRLVTKSGAIRWGEVRGTRIHWQKRAAVLAFIADITERRRAEEDRARLATAVEQAAESVVITDPLGRIEYVNPAFERLTGYSREEAIGKTPGLLHSGKHDAAFYRQLWDTISRGKVWHGRFTNRKKDGSLYEEDAAISPILNASGKIINYVAIKHDVTAQVGLERRLRQAQKMEAMGTLAGGIAHDFNNTLAIILGRCEITLQALPDPHPVRTQIDRILTAGMRAAGVVKQMLIFCRQAEQEQKPLHIQLIVKETIELLRATLPSTIEVRTEIDKECSPAMADPSQVHQVMMNLCTNAYQAMGESGGVLSVALREVRIDNPIIVDTGELAAGSYVRLSVSDNGPGIDKGVLPRIFDPFFTTKGPGEGTGLGLSTVHGIVAASKGAIQVVTDPGNGTTFHVFLPCVAQREAAEPEPLPVAPAGHERILVVDDDEDVAQMYQAMLCQMGYHVEIRSGAAAAFEAIASEPEGFDLVITDQIMPGMTGMEFAEQLMRVRPDLPVVLATGFSAQASAERAREMGIAARIMKPIMSADLGAVVRRVLDERAQRGV